MRWALPLIAISLAGCAAGSGQTYGVPVAVVDPFKPISSSCKDTPQTRREIAAHNSVLDTLRTGRDVKYGDNCPPGKAPVKKPPPGPATS
jgi:hypothetical protein